MIHRYHGLNCTKPPKITTVHSASDAFMELETRRYDVVITVPLPAEMDAFELGRQIKGRTPDLPVILLGHHPLPALPCFVEGPIPEGIDRIFVWNGRRDRELNAHRYHRPHIRVERQSRRAHGNHQGFRGSHECGV